MKNKIKMFILLIILLFLAGCGTYTCYECKKTTSKAYYDMRFDENHILCEECAREYWMPLQYEQYRVKSGARITSNTLPEYSLETDTNSYIIDNNMTDVDISENYVPSETITIRYDSNGGEELSYNNDTIIEITNGIAQFNLTDEVPKKQNDTFLGWKFINESEDNIYNPGQLVERNAKDGDVFVYYAQWVSMIDTSDFYTLKIESPEISILNINDSALISYTGEIMYEKQEDSYPFVAKNDGAYDAQIDGLMNGAMVKIDFYDSNGNQITPGGHYSNGHGVTAKKLVAGNSYEVRVKQFSSHYSPYTLTLGFQKEIKDISDKTIVSDSIEYINQCNNYLFIPELDGVYRFEFSEIYNGNVVSIYIINRLGETISYDEYCENSDGITVNMSAGEKYTIQVKQHTNCGNYEMHIMHQKKTELVNNKYIIQDYFEYNNQNNKYIFTPNSSDDIRLALFDLCQGMYVNIYIIDRNGYTVIEKEHCSCGNSFLVGNLEPNEQYEIIVNQDEQVGNYTLNIY